MQDPEKKPKHAGKHHKKEVQPELVKEPMPELEDAFLDEYDLGGTEGEIPLRPKKKKKSSAQEIKKNKKRNAAKKRKKPAKNLRSSFQISASITVRASSRL